MVPLVHCGSKLATSDPEMIGEEKIGLKISWFMPYPFFFYIIVKTIKQQP